MSTGLEDAIAVIGLAARFPGADSIDQFWANLRSGTESITRFTPDELRAAGLSDDLIHNPAYVPANGVLRDADKFDAAFFGMTPREAALTDPQHRVFLEVAWEALERAGYDATRVPGPVGVFAGAGLSTYLLRQLLPRPDVVESAGELPLLLGNNKDFVPTRASYKLDLRGPSINVNTACSTSLVATHLACQSLLDHHCDLALAGGVSVQVPQTQGYLYAEGGIGSPDGHCRAFDAAASGTVSGNGCGIVVLRRLADALADGDHIHAVIRGSAVNNDGADKAGFTAPSVTGQSTVIAEAQAVAGVDPTDISYVEAHGTGTPLGDPIEVAALSEAFAAVPPGHCALGSVKTNFGHLDEAAGAAGLIKTVLALEHGELPPSLHFATPNPRINFPATPFRVNAALTPWPRTPGRPRRTGVSSFGIGGTNAHVVLEEAPVASTTAPAADRAHALVLATRDAAALPAAVERLADWLEAHPDAPLDAVAFTLAQGRRAFAHRIGVVAHDATTAAQKLRALSLPTTAAPDASPPSVWVFSGQGAPYPGMLTGLYETEPVVREAVDRCGDLLGVDAHAVLATSSAEALRNTALAQPAVFVADYALAQLWLSRGFEPTAMIGHSLGEYVAACLAGVFSLEDALHLVARRGALMAALPEGAMLATGVNEANASNLATQHQLDLAAVNAPDACVLAGPTDRIKNVATALTAQGIAATRLETSHAFHSVMMEPILDAWREVVASVTLHPPQRRVISALSGRELTAAAATDPATWVRHVREPVRFASAVATARAACSAPPLWLEVGPGRGLASMVKRSLPAAEAARVFTSTRHAAETTPDRVHLLETLLALWRHGASIDWPQWFAPAERRRIPLPTYPFARERHWIDAPVAATTPVSASFDWPRLTAQLEATHAQLRRDPALVEHPRYAAFRPALDAWCATAVAAFLGSAAPFRSVAELTARLPITPTFARCLDFLVELVVAAGFVRRDEDGSLSPQRDWPTATEAATQRDALTAAFPEFRGIVRLVDHCVSHYPTALSGDIPAITVLYPEGRADILESTARENQPHTDKTVYLRLLREALLTRLAATPGQPLRILEVGIGDGLLAGELAPALRDHGVTYVATDLSRAFVNKARDKAAAAGLEFLEFAELDISRDPIAQGFAPASFDFIIGLDVVHATPRIGSTLTHLRRLLVPGGCFGIVEKVRPETWVDLVWGLAEGWWYAADSAWRHLTPLLPADRWSALLRSLHFAEVTVYPRDPDTRASTDYALLLAREFTTPPIEVAPWFQSVSWSDAPTPTLPSDAFDATAGLDAFIGHVTQLGGDARPQTLTLLTDGTPAQEMLTGALYTAAREFPQLTCRHLVRRADGSSLTRHLQPLADTTTTPFTVREHAVVVITGAFGSMGRVFARELASCFRARLVLLGRREVDAAWVQHLENLGAEVLARSVDITESAALAAVLDDARARFGPIQGVLHTAGVYGQGLMAQRSPAAIAATLAPKVTGTLNLARLTAVDPLDFMILCSSLAGVTPEPGQVDYATANAFLDAFAAHHRNTTGVPTTSVAWGVWQDLGMMDHPSISAAQKDAVRAEIAREGWSEIGSTLFHYLLQHGAAASHLLISPQPVTLPANLRHPLLRRRDDSVPGRTSYAVRLDPTQHWVVDEHRLDGLALLPGTGFLELARAAFTDRQGAGPVEFNEVYFLAPLTFPNDQHRDLRVVIQGDTFVVVSPLGPDRWLEHVRGEIRRADLLAPTVTPRADLTPTDPPPSDAVTFGPHWQNLSRLTFTVDGGVAQLDLASGCTDDLTEYALHPALFDMALGFVTLRHGLPDSLPFCYGRIVQYQPLPASFRSEVTVTGHGADHLELAATLFDAADHVLLTVSGYRLRALPPTIATNRPADQARLLLRPDDPVSAWRLVPAHRTAPATGEVEIGIEATGLNFIEVLYAHGMLPRSPELEDRFGLECAGRIVRVGADVTGFKIGDPVYAYANGCFASYLTVPTRQVARRPIDLEPAAAATLAGAYSTAHYALITSARLRAGETVLIHAAAGGVGLAAVHVARHRGATVYATAGSPEKRAFLRELGVAHVMDSRSAAFADEVRQLTGGRGVDVVLNSLSGDLLRAGLSVVAPRGRFVELGKRDLIAGSALDLAPFARILSFIVIDVGPDLPDFDELWIEVTARVADGTYPPLPHRSFPLREAREAFGFMAQAKHIGKVVLEPGDPATLLAAATEAPPTGRPLHAILGEPATSAPVKAPETTDQPPAPSTVATTAFSDPIEQAIAAIWSELLGVTDLGPDDDFFTLRGDSLLAAQVMARIQSALAVKLPLSAIFDAPTVAGLAARVRSLQAPTSAATSIDEDEEEGEL